MASHGRYNKEKKEGEFNITSLLDVLTILLVFLLQNYSAEGGLVTNADNLVLPNSESKRRPEEVSLQLAVTDEMILLDNQPLIPTDDVREIPKDEHAPMVQDLYERLKEVYAEEERMVALNSLDAVRGQIVIQVDKNIEFDVLFKVMFTCGSAGYNNMNFAVMERDE
ncbi:Adventurous gliding motility protein S [Chitinispirillum alkaliphilum]|nr:Adventurous gliding motility protein S [Chitinispirillum alkaliphilum]